MNTSIAINVRTITGLEECLVAELRELGASEIQARNRLVTSIGDLSLLYRANLWCRTAIRVLRPIANFPASNENEFYKGIQQINWSQWLSDKGTLAVDANVHSSFVTHSLFIAQLTKDAIVDQFRDASGHRPSVDLDDPMLRIAVNIFQNNVEISLDASGQSLHKRGYRKRTGEAPLSETLAAGILKTASWDGSISLIDPMAGSGTFCIEAALIQRNIAPGLIRQRFGFQQWPDFDSGLYERLVKEAKAAISDLRTAPILGFDKDPEVVQIARDNVRQAGVDKWVTIEQGDFFEWSELPPNPGMLVMNPPYDERISLEDVADFYQRIGDRLKHHYGGWTAQVLTGNLEAAKFIGLKSSSREVLYNGPIECRLLKFDIRAASKEAKGPGWRNKLHENAEWQEKSLIFANRLKKNFKHGSKKAVREGLREWRVYDWDIPELPFVLDIVEGGLVFFEIERNHNRTLVEHKHYMDLMVKTAGSVLGIVPERIRFKKSKRN